VRKAFRIESRNLFVLIPEDYNIAKGEMLLQSDFNKESKFYVQSLNRAFDILEIVSQHNDKGISVTEISKLINLPVSTTYRLLQNLLNWNYVQEDNNLNYFLGIKLMHFGFRVFDALEIRKIAVPKMKWLNELTKETIYLATLNKHDGKLIYIEKRESKRNVSLSGNVGSWSLIHSTANGKCLVSSLSDDEIRQLLQINGMIRLTNHTITSPDEYLKQIQKVRDEGYAVDDLENEDALRCIASPIYDFRGEVIASMSISGITANISEEMMHGSYKNYIIEATSEISKLLGYKPNR